jgi:hypothetical protein
MTASLQRHVAADRAQPHTQTRSPMSLLPILSRGVERRGYHTRRRYVGSGVGASRSPCKPGPQPGPAVTEQSPAPIHTTRASCRFAARYAPSRAPKRGAKSHGVGPLSKFRFAQPAPQLTFSQIPCAIAAFHRRPMHQSAETPAVTIAEILHLRCHSSAGPAAGAPLYLHHRPAAP